MTLTQQITNIVAIVNGDGGVNFLKIRFFLEDVERLASEGDKNAIEFSRHLNSVYKAVKHASTLEFM